MYTDIHSHILPGVDDGPKTLEESLELLRLSVEDGMANIVATPHFYAAQHVLSERLMLINSRFEEFVGRAKSEFPNVNFFLGMEVRYFDGISKSDSVELLCFKNTRTILLELGYEPISDKIIFEIKELYYNGFNVILAHIERYYKIKGFSKLKALIEEGFATAQMNATAVLEQPFARASKKLIKSGYISYMASDMHSKEHRPPRVKEAFMFVENKFGKETSGRILDNAFRFLENFQETKAKR